MDQDDINSLMDAIRGVDRDEAAVDNFRLLANLIPQIVWTATPNGEVDYYNQRWFDYTGLNFEQSKNWELVLHPDDLELCLLTWKESIATGKLYDIQYRFKKAPTGEYRWHKVQAVPARNPKGEILKWFGTCTDITEQKAAETKALEALRVSQEGLELGWRGAGFGMWDWNIRTQKVAFSDRLLEMLGFSADEVPEDFSEWAARLHPDDIDRTFALIEKHMREKRRPYDAEHRMRTKSGEWRWFHACGQAKWNENGEAIRMVGSLADITEKKNAEAALRTAEELKQAILDSSGYLIVAGDSLGNVHTFNKAAETWLGYRADEIIGKKTAELWHDKDEVVARAKELSEQLGITIEPGFKVFTTISDLEGSEEREWTYVRKDGSRFPVQLSINVLRGENKSIEGYLGIARDISKEKESAKEQKKLIAIIEESSDFVGVYDLDGNIQYQNHSANLMVGLPADFDVSKMKISDFHPPWVVGVLTHEALPETLEHGFWQGETALLHCDGHEIPVLQNINLHHDEKGNASYITSIMRNISESKEAEEKLKASEQIFRSAMESASIGMALVDLSGHWITVNSALCELLGYNQDEVLETTFQSLTHPDDVGDNLELARAALRGESQGYEMEKRYFHKSGRLIWVLLNVSLVRNSDGSPKYFVAQMQNITERKEMERIKNEFISIVSHELRTPLTSIRGSLGLIAGTMAKELPEKVNHLVKIAYNNSERLILLINDILDLEKIAAGHVRLEIRPESVAMLLHRAAEDNRGYAEKFNVEIKVDEIPSELLIDVDANRFLQVISNLLSNAAKFSRQNGIIRVYVEDCADGVRICVQDSGLGIPVEFQAHIFEKFSQADASASRERGGTGLGLNITKTLVEKMGGRIGFESVEGQGTTFWIEFITNANTHEETFVPTAAAISASGKILICEDDVDIARLLQARVEGEGFVADVTFSLEEARQKLLIGGYAAMTLDLSFPVGNGVDFIRELRGDANTRDLPIVVVSARAEEGRAMLNGEALNIIDWLTKPVDEREMANSLQRAVFAPAHSLPRVLHVEDDKDLSKVLATALQTKAEVLNVTTVAEARKYLTNTVFSLIILDIELPDGNGLALLATIHATKSAHTPILILSADEISTGTRKQVSAAMIKSRVSEIKIVETILSLIHGEPINLTKKERSDA